MPCGRVDVKRKSGAPEKLPRVVGIFRIEAVATEKQKLEGLPRHNHSAVMDQQNVSAPCIVGRNGCGCGCGTSHLCPPLAPGDKARPLGAPDRLVTVVMHTMPRGRYHRTLRHLIHNWATKCIKIVLRWHTQRPGSPISFTLSLLPCHANLLMPGLH